MNCLYSYRNYYSLDNFKERNKFMPYSAGVLVLPIRLFELLKSVICFRTNLERSFGSRTEEDKRTEAKMADLKAKMEALKVKNKVRNVRHLLYNE